MIYSLNNDDANERKFYSKPVVYDAFRASDT